MRTIDDTDVPAGCRRCTRCKSIQPIEAFCRKFKGSNLRHSQCTTCRNLYRYSVPRRDTYRKYAYGMSQQDYDKLFQEQSGHCAICGCDPRPRKNGNGVPVFVVEHNHSTGAIRGLVCQRCNTFIGSIELAIAAGLLEKIFEF